MYVDSILWGIEFLQLNKYLEKDGEKSGVELIEIKTSF